MSWFRRKPKQTTWCWCPTCGRDLCSTDSFQSDTDEGVLYECSWCEHRSLWDFDTFPCPVLIAGPPDPSPHSTEAQV